MKSLKTHCRHKNVYQNAVNRGRRNQNYQISGILRPVLAIDPGGYDNGSQAGSCPVGPGSIPGLPMALRQIPRPCLV